MNGLNHKVTIGYSLTSFAIGAFVFWLMWSEATKPVVDSWMEPGTIVDFVERKEGGTSRRPLIEVVYFIDVRTGDGEIVRVPAGTRRPTVGKRVKVEWLEYEDGSMAARLARKSPGSGSRPDPYSLNNI